MQGCRLKTKSSGIRCKNFAIQSWSCCRMHGVCGSPETVQGFSTPKSGLLKHEYSSRKNFGEFKKIKKVISEFY